ncbi:MAG: SURF1 family protein [Burkholderiaceae bacterium]
MSDKRGQFVLSWFSAYWRANRRVIALFCFGAGVALLTAQLGFWQIRRAVFKESLLQQQQAAAFLPALTGIGLRLQPSERFRPVRLAGRFLPDVWIMLDNRQAQGRPAVQVIQAFRAEPDGVTVAVDRGFLLRDPAQPRALPVMPEAWRAPQPLRLSGRLLDGLPRAAELSGWFFGGRQGVQIDGRLWSNYDARRFAAGLPAPVADFVIQATGDGLVVGDAAPAQRLSGEIAKHRGYAVQWFGLTMVLLVGTGWLVLRDYVFKKRNGD